jgi:hypothetical protein
MEGTGMTPIFDPKRMVFLVPVPEGEEPDGAEVHDDDETLVLAVPGRYEVCSRCNGTGTHWHPAFDNGITQEDRERDWDDESWSDLMSGMYDVQCSQCHGNRVEPVMLDYAQLSTPAQRLGYTYHEEWMTEEAEYRAMRAMERRMGA